MYEQQFGLLENPFLMSPDPKFLFLTPGHREALVGLLYAVLKRKGFVVLTGDAGTGKTTLLRKLLDRVPARTSFILNPSLSPSEFFEFALLDFGFEDVPSSKAQRLIRVQQFLLDRRAEGTTAVLIVDEAQRLHPEVLEEIRLLGNFETADGKLLQIVLAGQDELKNVLNRNELRQLKQRVAVRLQIGPLSSGEVKQYIEHRWITAGAKMEAPFSAGALASIADCSKGIPRVVNALCDNALLLAYGEGTRSVESRHIAEVAADLDLDQPLNNSLNGSNNPPAHPGSIVPMSPVQSLSTGVEKSVRSVELPALERYEPRPVKRSFVRRWASKWR